MSAGERDREDIFQGVKEAQEELPPKEEDAPGIIGADEDVGAPASEEALSKVDGGDGGDGRGDDDDRGDGGGGDGGAGGGGGGGAGGGGGGAGDRDPGPNIKGSQDPRFREDIFRSPAEQEHFIALFEQELRQRGFRGARLRPGALEFEETDEGIRGTLREGAEIGLAGNFGVRPGDVDLPVGTKSVRVTQQQDPTVGDAPGIIGADEDPGAPASEAALEQAAGPELVLSPVLSDEARAARAAATARSAREKIARELEFQTGEDVTIGDVQVQRTDTGFVGGLTPEAQAELQAQAELDRLALRDVEDIRVSGLNLMGADPTDPIQTRRAGGGLVLGDIFSPKTAAALAGTPPESAFDRGATGGLDLGGADVTSQFDRGDTLPRGRAGAAARIEARGDDADLDALAERLSTFGGRGTPESEAARDIASFGIDLVLEGDLAREASEFIGLEGERARDVIHISGPEIGPTGFTRGPAGDLDPDIVSALSQGGLLAEGTRELDQSARFELDAPEQVDRDTTAEELERDILRRNPELEADDITVSRTGDPTQPFDISADLDERDVRERIAGQTEGVEPDEVIFRPGDGDDVTAHATTEGDALLTNVLRSLGLPATEFEIQQRAQLRKEQFSLSDEFRSIGSILEGFGAPGGTSELLGGKEDTESGGVGAFTGEVAALFSTGLLLGETGVEFGENAPRAVDKFGVGDVGFAVLETGGRVTENLAQSAQEDPLGFTGEIGTELLLGAGAGAVGKRAFAAARGGLSTRGISRSRFIDIRDIERPDIRAGVARLTTFSKAAVPGGKRSIDIEDFPVEPARLDPRTELERLAKMFSTIDLEEALGVTAGEVTLFSARRGRKGSEFEPKSGRPFDPDAAFFAGSVARNFLDLSRGAVSGGLRSFRPRLPRPIAATRELIDAALGRGGPNIVATAGVLETLPKGVRTRAQITEFLQEQANTGRFFVRPPDIQSGEAEALVSAVGVGKVDPDPGAGIVGPGEATRFVEVGDPFFTTIRGERVPIQLFRQDVDADDFLDDFDFDLDADDLADETVDLDDVLSESTPGGARGTPIFPTIFPSAPLGSTADIISSDPLLLSQMDVDLLAGDRVPVRDDEFGVDSDEFTIRSGGEFDSRLSISDPIDSDYISALASRFGDVTSATIGATSPATTSPVDSPTSGATTSATTGGTPTTTTTTTTTSIPTGSPTDSPASPIVPPSGTPPIVGGPEATPRRPESSRDRRREERRDFRLGFEEVLLGAGTTVGLDDLILGVDLITGDDPGEPGFLGRDEPTITIEDEDLGVGFDISRDVTGVSPAGFAFRRRRETGEVFVEGFDTIFDDEQLRELDRIFGDGVGFSSDDFDIL